LTQGLYYVKLSPTATDYVMAKRSRSDCEGQCCPSGLHVIFTSAEKHLLRGQSFQGCEFNRIDFSSADLRETEFLNVSLKECDFSGADLRGASFIACDLRGANFAGAAFGRTRFDDSWLIGARGLSPWMSDYARGNGGLLWVS
jgi:uncharacterized protein YjbI with pentapeptide repeats